LVTDEPIDFSRGDVDGVELLLARGGKVTGDTRSIKGERLASAVLLFPVDSAQRTFPSRYVFQTLSDNSGRFEFAAVPPGSYYVVALRTSRDITQDLPRLEQLSQAAHQITVVSGTSVSVQLTTPDAHELILKGAQAIAALRSK
jgi:hypothetical protein